MSYTKPERIFLKSHPEYNEKWVQNLIANDPTILGLGDLILKDRERSQSRAGRLDLLLQDSETLQRYEVELQLGSTDESHIIRTIEYWDIEKMKYPQYDHCAVIIAEDITSRFLNVIKLFNGHIPLIAIQMQAMKVGEYTTVVFTTVMNEISLGLVDDDEDTNAPLVDKNFWEMRTSKSAMALTDQMLEIVKKFDPKINLNFTRAYVGFEKDGQPFNFMVLKPKKSFLKLELKIPQSDEIDAKIDEAGFETLDYYKRNGLYRLRLSKEDIAMKADILCELAKVAFDFRSKS